MLIYSIFRFCVVGSSIPHQLNRSQFDGRFLFIHVHKNGIYTIITRKKKQEGDIVFDNGN